MQGEQVAIASAAQSREHRLLLRLRKIKYGRLRHGSGPPRHVELTEQQPMYQRCPICANLMWTDLEPLEGAQHRAWQPDMVVHVRDMANSRIEISVGLPGNRSLFFFVRERRSAI